MANFLIIGKNFTRMRDYIVEHGHEFSALIDINANGKKDMSNATLCDFSNKESVMDSARKINSEKNVDGVISIYENYILYTAEIAKELNLPNLPINAAKACTDKELMRQKFSLAPEKISPEFTVVNNLEEVTSFANNHDFPLVLKPANLAKSLLVTKADNLDELVKNYQHTLEQIEAVYKKYAPNSQPKLILEEFITGSIHSVDAFIDSKGNVDVLEQVVDYVTGNEIGYDDNFHYSRTLPSALSMDKIEAIRHVAVLGCEALGMKNSPAHIEIILSQNGPRIVEIGARNGGYRERMHSLANGIDIVGAALQIAIGEKPVIKASRNDHCVTLELFPKKNGIFVEITNETELRELNSLAYYNLKVKPENYVGKSADGHKACAVIILHNSDTDKFKKDLNFVKNNVVVKTI